MTDALRLLMNALIPLMGVAGVGFAIWTYIMLRRTSEGDENMRRIAGEIHRGAMVFLKREYAIIVLFAAIVAVVLGIFLSVPTALSYITGAACYQYIPFRFFLCVHKLAYDPLL